MANLKEIKTRITSTKSTRQITKAMKLVSATKLRKAQDAVIQIRPYADRLFQVLVNLESSVEAPEHRILFQKRDINKVLILAISSDRGLCGAFNANIVKGVRKTIENNYKNLPEENITIHYIGKKAYEILNKSNHKHRTEDMALLNNLSSQAANEVLEEIIYGFSQGLFDEVRVVYNSFKNAALQIVKNDILLPVDIESYKSDNSESAIDYIFEPSKGEILSDLVPMAVKTVFYKNILDSLAGEHGARMVAMDKATENAGEIIDKLTLDYNQARQAAITTEILEIVGGAAALEG